MKRITNADSMLTTTPVGVYYCEETHSVVVQQGDNYPPYLYPMPADWFPEYEAILSSAESIQPAIDLERILAVVVHQSAAEKLIEGVK